MLTLTNNNYEDPYSWHLRVIYLYSKDNGKTWSAPMTVAEDPELTMFSMGSTGRRGPGWRTSSRLVGVTRPGPDKLLPQCSPQHQPDQGKSGSDFRTLDLVINLRIPP